MPPPIKMQDVKTARQLASDITQSGAKLYDLLENEFVERTERARALRFLDQAASTSGTDSGKLLFFSPSHKCIAIILTIVQNDLLIINLYADGPREQAYIERSIRDIIESTKQSLEDAR